MTTNNVIDTTTPWGRGAGGTDSTTCDNILQQVTSSITFTSGTTTIPFDNTIPQNTEGFQVGTITITPISSTSILEIYALCSASCIGSVITYTFALFRDSTANALQANYCINGDQANNGFNLFMLTRINSNSTSSTTFTFRVGGNNASTISINGYNGAGIFSTAGATPIIITEIET